MKKVFLLPNFISMGNFLCGLYAITFAIQGYFQLAGLLILIAMVFDFVDGTIARLTHTESAFGGQLDSLCDIVSFGVAPMVLVYTLFQSQYEKFGWFSGMLFAACGALRLARYNVKGKSDGKNTFVGLPIPAAAGIVVVYALYGYVYSVRGLLEVIPLLMIVAAFLMVSNIRYPSFRRLDFKRPRSLESMMVILLVALIASKNLYLFLLWSFSGYVILGLGLNIKTHLLGAKDKPDEVLFPEKKV